MFSSHRDIFEFTSRKTRKWPSIDPPLYFNISSSPPAYEMRWKDVEEPSIGCVRMCEGAGANPFRSVVASQPLFPPAFLEFASDILYYLTRLPFPFSSTSIPILSVYSDSSYTPFVASLFQRRSHDLELWMREGLQFDRETPPPTIFPSLLTILP